jgi:hypothetical protein
MPIPRRLKVKAERKSSSAGLINGFGQGMALQLAEKLV